MPFEPGPPTGRPRVGNRADRPGAGAGRAGRDPGDVAAEPVRDFPGTGSRRRSSGWTGSGRRSRSGSRTSPPTAPKRSARTSRRRPVSGAGRRVPRRRRPRTAQEQQEQARQATARERGRGRIRPYWGGLTPDGRRARRRGAPGRPGRAGQLRGGDGGPDKELAPDGPAQCPASDACSACPRRRDSPHGRPGRALDRLFALENR